MKDVKVLMKRGEERRGEEISYPQILRWPRPLGVPAERVSSCRKRIVTGVEIGDLYIHARLSNQGEPCYMLDLSFHVD